MTSATRDKAARYDYTKDPPKHIADLAAAIDSHAPSRVLMFGLGEAIIPKLLPDVTFDVVERNHWQHAADCPNVDEVRYAEVESLDWPNNGPYDVIASDINLGDAFLSPWSKTGGLASLASRLTPSGVYLALIYRGGVPYVTEMRIKEL